MQTQEELTQNIVMLTQFFSSLFFYFLRLYKKPNHDLTWCNYNSHASFVRKNSNTRTQTPWHSIKTHQLGIAYLDESVKRDLKDWDISEEVALDRSAWRLAINVPEP